MNPKFFKTQQDFRKWLEQNHDKETEIWVGFYKKASGKVGLNYAQALDEALCFGWIDGLTKSHDEISYKQRFTPRRAKSVWSKINTEHIARLISEGKMNEAGLKVVEEAKAEGRWEAAYDSPANIKIPEDFIKELNKNEKAKAFFDTLNKSNIYYIAYQLQNARKEETKIRRIENIILKLEKGEKFY